MRTFLINQRTNLSELDNKQQIQMGLDCLRRLIQHEMAWHNLESIKLKFEYGWMKQDLEIKFDEHEFLMKHSDWSEIFINKIDYELRLKIDNLVMSDVNLARLLENNRFMMVCGIYEDDIVKFWR